MHKASVLSATLVAALACAPLAFAQQAAAAPAGRWHGHHGMSMEGRMYGKLNLTDSQRTSIKQFRQQSFAQAKPQMQALRQARRAYESATPGTSAYQAAASNLAEAEADWARARATSRANLRAQVYGVLTPAQRTQLAGMRAERAERMQQWKQFREQHPVPQTPSASAD